VNPRIDAPRVAPHKGDVAILLINFKQQFGEAYPIWGTSAGGGDSLPITI
jgi:hypothetical protein